MPSSPKDGAPGGSTCPEPAALAQLLDYFLPEDRRQALEAHVGGCASCQARLLELAGEVEISPETPDTPDSETPSTEFLYSLTKKVVDEITSESTLIRHPERNAGASTPPKLPGLHILEELGHGGMGTVYKAVQEGLDRIVAVKVIDVRGANERLRARAARGAKILASLEHPNMVRIFQVGERDGRIFGVLEYIDGGDLKSSLKGGPWPVDRAVGFMTRLADVVGYLHSHGVVHGDLKPANILMAGWTEPKLVDFGIARLPGDPASPEPHPFLRGTPTYMAPEQAQGRDDLLGPATDVHALGLILFELLNGRPAFSGRSRTAILQKVCFQVPRRLAPQRDDVPAWLDEVIAKCLAKSPTDRFEDGSRLMSAIASHSET